MEEPIARGAFLVAGKRRAADTAALAKEAGSMLRALRADVAPEPAEADFLVLLVEEGADPRDVALPDLKDRAAAALGFSQGDEGAEARVAVASARKHLRAHGAALGPRELVFRPSDFGHMGLESDAMREKLEVLLRALVLDAERLRLKREGWEEPEPR